MNQNPTPLSRRRFLGLAGALGAVAASPLALACAGERLEASRQGQPASPYLPTPGAVDTGLVLVSIQLDGGNDPLNTVVPTRDAAYRSLRAAGGIAPENFAPLDADYGLFAMPYLAEQWSAGGLAIVHGVGYPESSLSHFDATDVWQRGDTDLSTADGWLGRGLDAFAGAGADPLLGVSIGELSPSMYVSGWSPVAIPDDGQIPWTPDFLAANPELVAPFEGLVRADRGDSALASRVRASQALVKDIAGEIGAISESRMMGGEYDELELDDEAERPAVESDGTERFFAGEAEVTSGLLGRRLALVADLVNGGLPTRAFHVRQEGYDTHANQTYDHPRLLLALDKAIQEFHTLLGPNAARVVVMTWTEFGRRPEWNGEGTDHGTAGLQMVVGSAVAGGHYGEPPPLTRFDADGNYLVTTDFRDYLGGVTAQALGVPVDRVVRGARSPIELLGSA